MELTWKLGERRVGKIFGDRTAHRDNPRERGISFGANGAFPKDNEPSVETVTFTVTTKSDDAYYDWYVKTAGNLSFGVCEEWGAVLEGTERVLDKNVPFGVGQHRMMTVSGIHATPVEVELESGSGDSWCGACVSCGDPSHYSAYWGLFGFDDHGAIAGGPAFSIPAHSLTGDIMEPVVGQFRRMTVPHIHGKAQVIVRVTTTYDGKVQEASCVQCPSPWHQDFPTDKWTMIEAEDFGVVDMLTEQAAAEQPKQETTMEMEARKTWALAQKWDKFVPKKETESKSGQKAYDGEVWVMGYDERYMSVVLVTEDGESAIVLTGKCDSKKPGEKTNFGSSALIRRSRKLLDHDETKMPTLWKKGELRFGNILAGATPDSKALYTSVAYKVVGTYGGAYEWEVELASGPAKGTRFGASENWDSTIVPEILMELRLGSYEVDPDGEKSRPSRFLKGTVYKARKGWGDSGAGGRTIKAGDLLQVTRDSGDIYAVGASLSLKEECWGGGVWEDMHAHLQLMRPVGRAPVAVPKGEQCGDRSTAYGLTCSERKDHEGDKHRNRERGAEWEKKDVIKLGNCHNGHRHADTGAMVLATMMVATKAGVVGMCEPCNVGRERQVAVRMRAHDAANPQPRRQERFMVESHTLVAGGVFGIGQ